MIFYDNDVFISLGLILLFLDGIIIYYDSKNHPTQTIQYQSDQKIEENDLIYPTHSRDQSSSQSFTNRIRFAGSYPLKMKIFFAFYTIGTILFFFTSGFIFLDLFFFFNFSIFSIYQLVIMLLPFSNIFGLYAIYRHNSWGRWIVILGYLIVGIITLFVSSFIIYDAIQFDSFDLLMLIPPVMSILSLYVLISLLSPASDQYFYRDL
jgi:hypothetical protein